VVKVGQNEPLANSLTRSKRTRDVLSGLCIARGAVPKKPIEILREKRRKIAGFLHRFGRQLAAD
jgi:hypothetical protein